MHLKLSLCLTSVALAFSLLPARADSFHYNVGLDIDGHTLSGSITTDCDNCVLSSSDFIQWQFSLDGNNQFSSIGSFPSVQGHGLIASPTALILPINPIPSLTFCSGGDAICSSGSAHGSFILQFAPEFPGIAAAIYYAPVGAGLVTSFAFDHYEQDVTIATAATIGVPGPIIGVGLPGLLFAFGGIVAWRSRQRIIRGGKLVG
jgi:hypothetical protein